MQKQYKNSITRARNSTEFEWQTWAVIFVVHALWLTLLFAYEPIGAMLVAPILLLTLTWHSSMCHEILHGHPTRNIWLNDLFGQLPLSLMVPYFIFKESHLTHHQNENLTTPDIDPESFFVGARAWQKKSAFGRALAWVNMTLAGRMMLAPSVAFYRLLGTIWRDIRDRNYSRIALYALHFGLAIVIVVFANRLFDIPPWQYLLIAYLSQSLLQMRSYFEHRTHEIVAHRSVVLESCLPFQLLYLNNNFHAIHHDHPSMPWYQLKHEYQRKRERYLADNGQFHYRGYFAWLTYLFKPIASPLHPFSHCPSSH